MTKLTQADNVRDIMCCTLLVLVLFSPIVIGKDGAACLTGFIFMVAFGKSLYDHHLLNRIDREINKKRNRKEPVV